jgi:hypothetical protein
MIWGWSGRRETKSERGLDNCSSSGLLLFHVVVARHLLSSNIIVMLTPYSCLEDRTSKLHSHHSADLRAILDLSFCWISSEQLMHSCPSNFRNFGRRFGDLEETLLWTCWINTFAPNSSTSIALANKFENLKIETSEWRPTRFCCSGKRVLETKPKSGSFQRHEYLAWGFGTVICILVSNFRWKSWRVYRRNEHGYAE